MSQSAPASSEITENLRAVLRGLIHQRWRSMAAFAGEHGLPRDWVQNRVGSAGRTAIDLSDLAVFAYTLDIDADELVRRALEFPLRRDWELLDGDDEGASPGQLAMTLLAAV